MSPPARLPLWGGRRNDENDRGDHPDRKLHPLGKLGFHTTALTVPKGQYDESTVAKAYNLASQSMAEILQLMPPREFPRSLLVDMLATPSDQMLYVDTVAKAARWNIDVVPTVSPEKLTKLSLLRACMNGETKFFDEPNFPGATFSGIDIRIDVEDSSDGLGPSYTGVMADGFRQELVTGCEVRFDSHMPDWEDPALRQTIWVSMGDSYEDFPAYVLFPAKTPIRSLARVNDPDMEIRAVSGEQERINFKGRCFVIALNDGQGTLSDDEACLMERDLSVDENLVRTRIEGFRWPSGAKTVVKNDTEINGHKVARYDSESARKWLVQKFYQGNEDMVYFMDCWRNSKSGNLFCFASDPSITTDPELQKNWYKTQLY
ncbi:hypothetical protein SAMN05444000_104233 [Shimia gijangensis]|uniref:Uncharacterized protein n=1 Tax=Shimia gijangensis TaxID=1470563 RepID=A0A1M6G1Y2_9RHOB|nr:hypothetical protein [Shimia gijangensis]SHJ03985.1 hypothetical protein SAMN05444000_104233 [Shimia gijangensis]